MKEVQSTLYEAVDGQKFDTIEECREHEIGLFEQLVASLKFDVVREALKRAGILVRAAPVPRKGSLKDAAE